MELSIVIPAFNEEAELPACLASVRAAVAELEASAAIETIVCDNHSTDRTAEVARRLGATVVYEAVNQISRARNAGAAVARGEWLLFIDADSRLSTENLRRVLAIAREGRPVVGGGCVIGFDDVPWWVAPSVHTWNLISTVGRLAAGSFIFCRAGAFRDLGGFSTELFAAEEIEFSRRLRRWGRARGMGFVILRGRPHVSSGRKFRRHRPRELLALLGRFVFGYRRMVRQREGLGYFYDGRR